MTDYSPSRKEHKMQNISERRQMVLDTLWDYGGDAVKAARAAGYKRPHAAVDNMHELLIAKAERAMARLAPKSVATIEAVLDSDGEVKQANEKLKAVQLILDRTNPKVEKVDISGEVKQGIFILPAKKVLDEPT